MTTAHDRRPSWPTAPPPRHRRPGSRPDFAPSHATLGQVVLNRSGRPRPGGRHRDAHRRWWPRSESPRAWCPTAGRQRHSGSRAVRRWPRGPSTARGQPAMTVPPGLRKFTLTAHLTFSVGWIGAVVTYLALGVSATTSEDAETIRAAWIAMELTGWFLIALVLTVFATAILLLHMPTVSSLADVARQADDAALQRLGGDLFHPGLGLVVLLAITVLNVYKPRGLTRYGWRKQQEQRRRTPATTGGTVQP